MMADMSKLRRWSKIAAVSLLGLLVALQLVPYGHAHDNPPVTGEPRWDAPRTRELFTRACADCHSHETVWPWTAYVAPASWLVQHDVEEGREHFNVSTWDRGPGDADEAAEEFEDGEMPPGLYTLMHPSARLAPEERDALLAGLRATFGGR
jgi:mono/diheme cytochrome c family protein